MLETMDTHMQISHDGTILYDAGTVPQVDHAWFDPERWRAEGRVSGRGGGRGGVCYLDSPAGACVLRHYHRGGMMAGVLGDRYLWTGRGRTRSFAEFRLLSRLRQLNLPVPLPMAARYVRHGFHYTADILTRRIEQACTLAECIGTHRLDAALAEACGAVIAHFHNHGVWHADLNAHNLLVTGQRIYLIDFDRGELRTTARRWQQANLRRLRRSLVKLGVADQGNDVFDQQLWTPLMHGYTRALEAPAA